MDPYLYKKKGFKAVILTHLSERHTASSPSQQHPVGYTTEGRNPGFLCLPVWAGSSAHPLHDHPVDCPSTPLLRPRSPLHSPPPRPLPGQSSSRREPPCWSHSAECGTWGSIVLQESRDKRINNIFLLVEWNRLHSLTIISVPDVPMK